MIYVVGPGHSAPSILANLWLEGSLEKFYSEYTWDAKGLTKLISCFSTTDGFPSHINAETLPIHEGGELGYAPSSPAITASETNPTSKLRHTSLSHSRYT